jgi:hypothetical protein
MTETTQPRMTIRRFDIFAEWNRLKGREKLKLSAGESRAYGLAVAKVVAGRKQRREAGNAPEAKEKPEKEDGEEKSTSEKGERWWQHLGSDDEFRRVVVRRMGEDFYKDVFAPAVRKAWDAGKDYADIRDTLRSTWNETLDKTKVKAA